MLALFRLYSMNVLNITQQLTELGSGKYVIDDPTFTLMTPEAVWGI